MYIWSYANPCIQAWLWVFFSFLFPSVAVHEREREHTSKFYLDHRCSFLTKHVNFTGARPMTLLTFLTRSPDLGQRSS